MKTTPRTLNSAFRRLERIPEIGWQYREIQEEILGFREATETMNQMLLEVSLLALLALENIEVLTRDERRGKPLDFDQWKTLAKWVSEWHGLRPSTKGEHADAEAVQH